MHMHITYTHIPLTIRIPHTQHTPHTHTHHTTHPTHNTHTYMHHTQKTRNTQVHHTAKGLLWGKVPGNFFLPDGGRASRSRDWGGCGEGNLILRINQSHSCQSGRCPRLGPRGTVTQEGPPSSHGLRWDAITGVAPYSDGTHIWWESSVLLTAAR